MITRTIKADPLLWPMQYPEQAFSRYAVSVRCDNIPPDLLDYVTPKPAGKRTVEFRPELADKMLCRINQPFNPRITFDTGIDGLRAFDELQKLAKIANIGPTRLFHDIPAMIAVEPIEMIDYRQQNIRPVEEKRLQILAIQFTYADLIDNFDRIHKEHFR